MTGIEIDLQHRFGDFVLDVKFEAPDQGVTALFGRSGSGKSSILRGIAGLLKGARGSIRINGDIWQDEHRFVPSHRRSLGYVFQESNLFPHLSVRGNLEFGRRRTRGKESQLRFDDVVGLLGVESLLDRSTTKLSGGERQRVAIARALLTSPTLLLLDEPLSALDHTAKKTILPYLTTLHDQLGIPSLYVSHDPNEVARLADHMILIDRGSVVAQGKAADLLTRLDLPVAEFDDATSLLDGRVSAHDHSYHLTWIGMHGGRLAIPRENMVVGKHARVEVRARDVSLSLSPHSDTSIINILPARVIDTREIDASQLLVRLELDDGQHLLSRITRRSGVALDLSEGMVVYAQVKSVALAT